MRLRSATRVMLDDFCLLIEQRGVRAAIRKSSGKSVRACLLAPLLYQRTHPAIQQLKPDFYIMSKAAVASAARHSHAFATRAFEQSLGRQRKVSAFLTNPPFARTLFLHGLECAVLDAVRATDRIHRVAVVVRPLTTCLSQMLKRTKSPRAYYTVRTDVR